MIKLRLIRNALLFLAIAICLLALLLIVESGAGSREKENREPAPSPKLSSLTSVKESPADANLSHSIDRAIDESEVSQARWGVFAVSLSDGHVLYSRNGDKLFTPASNMKIYTTAVALDLLGADYRWRTSVYADRQPENGLVDGDITLFGRGAPDLRSTARGDAPSLDQLADQLYHAGVRHVRGNVVGDASYFRGEFYGLGWQWNDLQWYFGAEPSALTVDENSFELTLAPGSKPGSTASLVTNVRNGYVHLINNTTTGDREATTSIGINRSLSSNDLRVWGEFPVGGRSFSAFLSVYDPALWAATQFKAALVARGITVEGEVRSRDFRSATAEKFDPQKAIELAHQDSESLGVIVRRTNKESNNLYAELILRTLGKERGATALDPDPRKNQTRGDDEAGTAVVRSWLTNAGIPVKNLAIRDGSGLSRLDLITPETTARLLLAIAQTGSATVFHDSLPVAGRDGTLEGRLKRATDRIFAKTGTLAYDHSLSGYAMTGKGERLVFSIACNDVANDREAVRVVDEIAGLIAGLPPAKQ
jgi:serine-type D-Ala-D-Ala carboxypeptidase/endopeptidase (penicillin-binding protein 4)